MKVELPIQPDRYDIERRRLLELDIEKVAVSANTSILNKKSSTEYQLVIPFFNSAATLTMPEGDFECPEPGLLSFLSKLLILHYLCHSSPENPEESWVSYSQLPGGMFYAATLSQNFRMLADRFGSSSEALADFERRCASLGGVKSSYGDSAFTLRVLPKISTLVIIHGGDEEFAPEANVLVDKNVTAFLDIDFAKLLIIETIGTIVRRK